MTLYDPTDKLEIPNDLADLIEPLRQSFQSNLRQNHEKDANSENTILDRFDIEAHVYEHRSEANAGFLGGLFRGEIEEAEAGIIQEAKNYAIVDSDSRKVEFGVGVRLAVATASASTTFELNVPNLAAAGQLGMAKTKAGIYVVGFAGPLGDIVPAPDTLNVETYSKFIEAFKKIQTRVFSAKYSSQVAPTILGWTER